MWRFATIVILGTFVHLVLWPLAAGSHAFPERSEPRVGQTVTSTPPQVRIWFDGALEPLFSRMHVEDMSGQRVDRGDGQVDPADATLLETDMKPLPPGTYHVFWSVVARDGHRTEGDFTFTFQRGD